MIIEQANIDDSTEILSLQKLCYRSEALIYNDFRIPPLIQTLEEIKSDFREYFFLRAVEDKRIIGSVRARIINSETCYIGRLIVHPDFQNQGIGTELMDAMEDIFKDCDRYELITGYRSKKNLSLYKKRGYKEFKTEQLNDNLDLVYLEKYNLG